MPARRIFAVALALYAPDDPIAHPLISPDEPLLIQTLPASFPRRNSSLEPDSDLEDVQDTLLQHRSSPEPDSDIEPCYRVVSAPRQGPISSRASLPIVEIDSDLEDNLPGSSASLHRTRGTVSADPDGTPNLADHREAHIDTDSVQQQEAGQDGDDDGDVFIGITNLDSSESSDDDAPDDGDARPKIYKPAGEAGRPNNGGYNLRKVLKWSDDKFRKVSALVKKHTLKTLNCEHPFSVQPPDRVRAIREKCLQKYPDLNQYHLYWPIDDLIRNHLKYQKTVLKKQRQERMCAEAQAVLQSRERTGRKASKKDSRNTRPRTRTSPRLTVVRTEQRKAGSS
ncbi:hypothetical protein VNI00_018529 [Paramarasmius palmivorus]|uniref:Uncharacterized protein n=1 Tax=Paramarasmius palmivorus TaxID=297713 RepID=A0AAW0AXD2_9AGAR